MFVDGGVGGVILLFQSLHHSYSDFSVHIMCASCPLFHVFQARFSQFASCLCVYLYLYLCASAIAIGVVAAFHSMYLLLGKYSATAAQSFLTTLHGIRSFGMAHSIIPNGYFLKRIQISAIQHSVGIGGSLRIKYDMWSIVSSLCHLKCV